MSLMLGTSQIGLKALAQLCRRLAIATEAGIDIRKIWEREAASEPSAMRWRLAKVRDGVAAGQNLTEIFARFGNYFPVLFRELVHVGEQTGSLAEVFARLADYYEHRLTVRRIFLVAMIWPMLQLAGAVMVIGIFILVMGFVGQSQGSSTIDPLGLGLSGTSGFLTYVVFLGFVGTIVALLIWAMQRGLLWTRPLQHGLMRIPGVGRCLKTLAVARLAWVLHLTLNVEMDLRRVLPLALRSTGNDYYICHTESVVADVVGGYQIHEAFHRTGAFSPDFLDAMEIGEQSGQLVESMGRLSKQYEAQAKTALATLATLVGMGVWAIVAGTIIFFIFRLAFFYIGAINDAVNF